MLPVGFELRANGMFVVARLCVLLEPAECAEYERLARPFEEMRRALFRVHPGADYKSILASIARTRGGYKAISNHHKATNLAAFPSAKRTLVRSLLRRHRTDKALVFTAFADHAYTIALDSLVPVTSCLLRSRSDESEPPGSPPVRKRFMVRSRAGDPVARTHVLPAETDSAVERRLQRDIRRLQSGWAIDRETDAVRAGGAVFFPDFTLRRGGDRVLVEIVGYYTTAYLEHKIRTLKAAGLRNIIVCIDSSLACSEGDIAAPVVLRYSKRIDAAELIAAAERVVG